MTFEEWKKRVDKELVATCGMSSDCLMDCPYYDWFKDKVSPKIAAKRAIRYNKEN